MLQDLPFNLLNQKLIILNNLILKNQISFLFNFIINQNLFLIHLLRWQQTNLFHCLIWIDKINLRNHFFLFLFNLIEIHFHLIHLGVEMCDVLNLVKMVLDDVFTFNGCLGNEYFEFSDDGRVEFFHKIYLYIDFLKKFINALIFFFDFLDNICNWVLNLKFAMKLNVKLESRLLV